MGKKKLTPVKKLTRTPPTKLKTSRGHDGSFQTRIKIAVFANRGATASQIAKEFDITWDMAKRWSDRSEEVMSTGSVQSKRVGKVGSKPKFATPTAKKKLYKKLKRTTQTKLAKDLGVGRSVSKSICIRQTMSCLRRFAEQFVGLAVILEALFLIASRKHRSLMIVFRSSVQVSLANI